MAVYLDSADMDDARRAAKLGFLGGATTNPALVARTGRAADQVVAELCEILPGTIFHQVTSPPGLALEAEIARFRAISNRVAFKFPCTLDYLPVIHNLSRQHVICAATGVFAAAQAYIAAEAGARYAVPYVNRTTRLCGDGPGLVAEMSAVLGDGACEILAASIKSPAEAVDTLLAGALHLTLSWKVLAALAEHRLTELAMEEFARAVLGP